MNNRQAAGLWFLLGGAALVLLWVAVLGHSAWSMWAGGAFLSVPFVAALAMTWPRLKQDSFSAVCALALIVLFCLAWFI
jgi:hypothetical protein